MKITFISNFMNHHQLPLCRALANVGDIDFTFIATRPIDAERSQLGYIDMNGLEFVLCSYCSREAEKQAEKLCMESDVLIVGSAPERFFTRRLAAGKLTFRYNERIFKKGLYHAFSPRAYANIRRLHGQYSHLPVYLLCAGAYVASDFNRMGAYRGKCMKWGYFPEVKRYDDIARLISEKKPHSILYAGRFIDWKHPELAIAVAEQLQKRNIDFHLNMIGTGEMLPKISQTTEKRGLSEKVSVLGPMSPEKVRLYMEKSEMFLFTSDFNEGWGAVLNEAMNSACAVVASHAIGAVPYLIENRKNGFIYKNGSLSSLTKNVLLAMSDDDTRKAVQTAAYRTICEKWNADVASQRLLSVCRSLLDGKPIPDYTDGPCSAVTVLKNNWFGRSI